MQNKFALIGITAAVIILIGGGMLLFLNKNKTSAPINNSTSVMEEKKEETTVENDIQGLLSSGKTQQCSFSSSGEFGETKGTVYVTSGKIRADITTTADKKTTQINIIRVGDDNYIWGGAFPKETGLKMTLTSDEFMKDEESKKYFDPSKKVYYKCDSWILDSSVFNPPTKVKFQDLSKMMEKINPSSQCSLCSSLTGDAKTACMTSFNCK